MQITDYRHDYHRNGISGEGSTVAFFRATDEAEGWDAVPFMAVMWGCTSDNDEAPTEAMVFQLKDIANVAVAYLDGQTPDAVDNNARGPGDVYVGAWRSTDSFLPALLPYYRRVVDTQWRRLQDRMNARASV